MKELLKCFKLENGYKVMFIFKLMIYVLLSTIGYLIGIFLIFENNLLLVLLGGIIMILSFVITDFFIYKKIINEFCRRYIVIAQITNVDLAKKLAGFYLVRGVVFVVISNIISLGLVLVLVSVSSSIILVLFIYAVVMFTTTWMSYTVALMYFVALIENQYNSKPGFKAVFETLFKDLRLLFGFSYKKTLAIVAVPLLLTIFLAIPAYIVMIFLILYTPLSLLILLCIVVNLIVSFVIFYLTLTFYQFVLKKIPNIIRRI